MARIGREPGVDTGEAANNNSATVGISVLVHQAPEVGSSGRSTRTIYALVTPPTSNDERSPLTGEGGG